MAVRGKDFIGIVEPVEKIEPGVQHTVWTLLRDNFTITTWLCFGALVQGVLFLVGGRLALIPAVATLTYKTLDAYAQSIGWKHNIYMDGVITKKISTAFPDETGSFGATPSNSEVVVFLIGTRVNHPLGMLAPGWSTIVSYFPQMINDLNEHAEEFGFLGVTSWVNSGDRATNNEILEVCYFRTTEGLHKFAHSEYHRKGWDWWNRTIKDHPHLSIYHETYHVPKGHWETIYANSHISGINATVHKVTDEMTGKEMYTHPLVDASKGILKTSAGRMHRGKGDEHDAYGDDPYVHGDDPYKQ